VKTVIPDAGVFRFETVARLEGRGGLRVAIPAPIVRGLAHLGWGGKRLHARLVDSGQRFIADVRPHPSATMIALPKSLRGGIEAGEIVKLEVWTTEVKRTDESESQ
jgi:hypothetical protein